MLAWKRNVGAAEAGVAQGLCWGTAMVSRQPWESLPSCCAKSLQTEKGVSLAEVMGRGSSMSTQLGQSVFSM